MSGDETEEEIRDDFPIPAPKRRRISTDGNDSQRTECESQEHMEGDVSPTALPIIEEEIIVDVKNKIDEPNDEESEAPTPYNLTQDHLLNQPSAGDTPYSTDIEPASSPAPHPDAHSSPPPSKPRRSPALSYKPALTLHGHTRPVAALSYSPDGALLASASADAVIKIWDSQTGKPLHTLRGHLSGVSCLAWSPIPTASPSSSPEKDYLLASGGDDKTIRLWRVGRHTAKPHPTPLLGHHNYILSLAFSPKGNLLVSGATDEAVILWSVHSCSPLRILPAHNDPVYGVDFSSDGTLVASAGSDGLIRIWDAASGQCLRTFFHEEVGGGRPGCLGTMFSPNGRYVAGWYADGGVRLWDYVGEGAGGGSRCVKTYEGAAIKRYSMRGAWGVYRTTVEKRRKVDATLADGEMEGELQYDGAEEEGDGKQEEVLRMEETRAFLVSGGEDGDIVLWDVVSKEVMQRLESDQKAKRGHRGTVFGARCHPTRQELASCGMDKTVRIWRMKEEEADESKTLKHDAVREDIKAEECRRNLV